MLNKDKALTANLKDKSKKYKVEIASEIGPDNYYYIYSNLTLGENKLNNGKFICNIESK